MPQRFMDSVTRSRRRLRSMADSSLPSQAAVEDALESVRTGLQLDGYDTVVDLEEDRTLLTILPGVSACSDCLAPDAVIAAIARDALHSAGLSLPVSVVHAEHVD